MNAKRFAFLAVISILSLTDRLAYAGDGERAQFFESKIRPILIKHCYECHSEKSEDLGGSLLLDSREATLQGGDSGPAVVPA